MFHFLRIPCSTSSGIPNRTRGTLKRGEPHRSGLLTTWMLRCRGGPDQRAISGLWCWAKTALSPAQTRPRSGTFCSLGDLPQLVPNLRIDVDGDHHAGRTGPRGARQAAGRAPSRCAPGPAQDQVRTSTSDASGWMRDEESEPLDLRGGARQPRSRPAGTSPTVRPRALASPQAVRWPRVCGQTRRPRPWMARRAWSARCPTGRGRDEHGHSAFLWWAARPQRVFVVGCTPQRVFVVGGTATARFCGGLYATARFCGGRHAAGALYSTCSGFRRGRDCCG